MEFGTDESDLLIYRVVMIEMYNIIYVSSYYLCRLPTFVMESDTPTSHISVEDQSILTQDITTTDISTLIDAQVYTLHLYNMVYLT